MPSGPPELHEYWCNQGPYDGDVNAEQYLKTQGYVLNKDFSWTYPVAGHKETEEESKALNYLCWEWGYDGAHNP